MSWSFRVLVTVAVCAGSAVAQAALISFSANYDGSYAPDSPTPPAGQSTWSYGASTLRVLPNLPSAGLAAFFDDRMDARLQVSRVFTSGQFSANQSQDEYTYYFHAAINARPYAQQGILFGMRDEWNGTNVGKKAMLTWDANGKLAMSGAGSTLGDTNYFDGLFHTYTVQKAIVSGVTQVLVSVDGTLLSTIPYSSLPAGDGILGFGYFSTTFYKLNVLADSFGYFGAGPNPIPIPEPQTYVLLGAGLLAWWVYAGRKRWSLRTTCQWV